MASAKTMMDKLSNAAPYNIFYNAIPEVSNPEDTNSIAFTDFLCPSLGNLKCSLHIASKVDIQWLIKQYEIMRVESKPLTVLYGTIEGKGIGKSKYPNVTLQCLLDETTQKRPPYINHHEKISIYVYDDNSLRVVISTCNLRPQWELFNHGFWVSPLCPPLQDDSPGESPTNFKADILKFLNHYELESLNEWIRYVEKADFSEVAAFLIASVPGRYEAELSWSHIQEVQNVLTKHCFIPKEEESEWPLLAQASSMGMFGDSPDVWLRSFFVTRLASARAELKIIFPTWKQVKNGRFDPEVVGEGLRYSRRIDNGQKWLRDYLYQWKADALGRTKIIPHTKMYCRVSPCGTQMAWFLLTTSNINRGAWGQWSRNRNGAHSNEIFVRNCELGVMLVPKFFGENYFQVTDDLGTKVFPLIYDLPLRKYTEKDHPWTLTENRKK